MENKDVISLSLDVVKILLGVCILIGLASLSYEIRPLLDGFEMPDFSNVNELMRKAEPLLELFDELADPTMRLYFREGKDLLKRFDAIQGGDLTISLLPAIEEYYSNRSCE